MFCLLLEHVDDHKNAFFVTIPVKCFFVIGANKECHGVVLQHEDQISYRVRYQRFMNTCRGFFAVWPKIYKI